MSGRAYRAHALAELSSIPSFDSRCASANASDALKLKYSIDTISDQAVPAVAAYFHNAVQELYICTKLCILGEDGQS